MYSIHLSDKVSISTSKTRNQVSKKSSLAKTNTMAPQQLPITWEPDRGSEHSYTYEREENQRKKRVMQFAQLMADREKEKAKLIADLKGNNG